MAVETHASESPDRFRPPPSPLDGPDGVRTWSGCSVTISRGYRPVDADVRVPPSRSPVPAVVWIHGGAWRDGDRRTLPETLEPDAIGRALLSRGLACVAVDYRLSGEICFPGQLHDVKAAVRYVRRFAGDFGIDADRIAVWGESAGGHLAALLGVTAGNGAMDGVEGVGTGSTEVVAVVDWYGVHDLTAMPEDRPDRAEVALVALTDVLLAGSPVAGADPRVVASPLTYVSPGSAPMLLIHGDADVVVPHSQSEAFAAACEEAGSDVVLRTVPGADHIFTGCDDVPGIVSSSADWLAERLRPGPAPRS